MFLKVIFSVIAVVVAYSLYRWFLLLIVRSIEKLGKEIQMRNTIRFFLGFLTFIVTIMVVLRIWNISILPLLTGVGIGGLVVGLALQEPLANLFSGLFLITTRAVKEGEAVEVGGVQGTVELVNLNHTVIRTWDGRRVLIPNKMVWGQAIVHFWPDGVRRQELRVSIPYTADMKKAFEAIQKALSDEQTVEREPSPNIVFGDFGPSSVNVIVRFWVNRENFFLGVTNLAMRIKDYLEKEGMRIPYPQLEVHLSEEFVKRWR